MVRATRLPNNPEAQRMTVVIEYPEQGATLTIDLTLMMNGGRA